MSNWLQCVLRDKPIRTKEKMFARVYTYGILHGGIDKADAYMNVTGTKSRAHANQMARALLRTKRVLEEIDRTMAVISAKQGVTDTFIFQQIKEAIENAEAEKKVPGLKFWAELLEKGGFRKNIPDSPYDEVGREIPMGEVPIIDAHEDIPAQLGEGSESK